jgi:hypothetical protein
MPNVYSLKGLRNLWQIRNYSLGSPLEDQLFLCYYQEGTSTWLDPYLKFKA